MRSVRACLLMLMLVPGSLLSAQTSPEKRLVQAFALEREGKLTQATAAIQALLDAQSLNAPNTGKAWNILALAYADQGSFALAQHAYEQSIHLLERSPNSVKDYAMALDGFGGLYLAMGDPKTAARIKLKALHLYEKIEDHTGIAIACSDLAGLAFREKRVRDGRKYLEHSLKEELLPNELDSDNLAAISSMQGWLAQVDGDVSLAITRYRTSFDLWRKGHGEEHPSTGWGYILLGNAKAEAGDVASARADIELGLDILDRTLGRQNPRYMTAEIAYSRVLDRMEAHAEADRIRINAEQELKEFYREQSVRSTTSAAAFR